MTSSTDGEGHTTQYEYNVAGQVRAIVDPTGERETYLYDGEDRLISRTDRNGVTVEMGYNLYGAPHVPKSERRFPGQFLRIHTGWLVEVRHLGRDALRL